MSNIILLNKPYHVLSQFSESGEKTTLASFIKTPGFYPAGRLDFDSEGLMILTDDGALQHHLAHPQFKMEKTYWAQVEGIVSAVAIEQLAKGVVLKDGLTRPAKARVIAPPHVWDRSPPIRERKDIPTTWIELKITEGKNRQVRRMTASVGHPTLRLIRYAIGAWTIEGLAPGEQRQMEANITIPSKNKQRPLKNQRSTAAKTGGQASTRKPTKGSKLLKTKR
jgi:23S rRNA pseudouridine2457 synthase